MDERNKKILVVIGIVLITSVAFLQFGQAQVAAYTDGEFPLGYANCSVELGVKAMKDGVVLNSPIMNNPLYLDGVEVDGLLATIHVRAEGTDVDWNTLSVTCIFDVNGQHLNSWDWSILDFTSKDGGHEIDVSWTIDELDYFTGSVPDYTDGDGIGHFEILATADVYGSIDDIKDNLLSDSIKVTNSWDLTDSNGATADPLIVPEFTTEPASKTVDYGLPFTFTWIAKDDNPSTYKITTYYPDGGNQIVSTGSWTTGQQIIYTGNALFSSLAVDPVTGSYESVDVSVTCFVYDDDGQQMFDSIILTVNPPTAPTTDPITWEKATSTPSGTVIPKFYEIAITYYPNAIYTPKDWKLYVNGVQKQSGAWNGGSVSVLVEQQIDAGVKYNFMLTVTDTYGNSDSYTVAITGESSTIPQETIGDPTDDRYIVNAPFELPYLGTGGSYTLYAIIAAFGVFFLYKRWREN